MEMLRNLRTSAYFKFCNFLCVCVSSIGAAKNALEKCS